MQLFVLVSLSAKRVPFLLPLVTNSFRKDGYEEKRVSEKDVWKQDHKIQGAEHTILVTNSALCVAGREASFSASFPTPIYLVCLLVLHLGSFGHFIVDLDSCIRGKCLLAFLNTLFSGNSMWGSIPFVPPPSVLLLPS